MNALNNTEPGTAPKTEQKHNTTRKHLRGSALLFAGRLIAVAINFVVQVITVRYLSKEHYGMYALSLSLVNVVALFCAAGMDKTLSRFLPIFLQEENYAKVRGSLVLLFGTVTSAAAIVLGAVWAAFAIELPFLPTDLETQTVYKTLMLLSAFNALDAAFIALFNYKVGIVKVIGVCALLGLGYSLLI